MAREAVRPARRHLAALLDVAGRPEPQRRARATNAGAEARLLARRLRQPHGDARHRRRPAPRGAAPARRTTLTSAAPSRAAARTRRAPRPPRCRRCTHAPRRHCRLWKHTHVGGARDRHVGGTPRPVALGTRGPEQADQRRAHRRRQVQRPGVARHDQPRMRAPGRAGRPARSAATPRRARARAATTARRSARSPGPQVTTLGRPSARRAAPPARRTARAASACSCQAAPGLSSAKPPACATAGGAATASATGDGVVQPRKRRRRRTATPSSGSIARFFCTTWPSARTGHVSRDTASRPPARAAAPREAEHAPRARQPRERRRLDQPLQVERGVVALRAQLRDGAQPCPTAPAKRTRRARRRPAVGPHDDAARRPSTSASTPA